MPSSSMTPPQRPKLVVGVDTHKVTHVAQAKDLLGRRVGDPQEFPANLDGYARLLEWTQSLGDVEVVGVEGTGSYGAGLARYLASQGVTVKEVIRPNRQRRRRNGKSDPADADAAASAVLAGEASGTPKAGTGPVEAIRALRIARSSAVKARTQAINAIKALLVTAPDQLRSQLQGLPVPRLIAACLELDADPDDLVLASVTTSLKILARRHRDLGHDIDTLHGELDRLTQLASPALRALTGVGPDNAAALLVAAGDNPERLRSEPAFASLCGASPVEASSGQITRHRLNRAGNRQANAALHRIVTLRLRWHAPTRDYMAKRTSQGKSTKETIRCLKRYVAREAYHALQPAAIGP